MSKFYDEFISVTKQQVAFYSKDLSISRSQALKEGHDVLCGIHQASLFILSQNEYYKFSDEFYKIASNFFHRSDLPEAVSAPFDSSLNYHMVNKVRELREASGLTQTELGDLCGLSQNSISSLEVGQYSPRAFNALKICQVLGCKFDDCFYLEPEDV